MSRADLESVMEELVSRPEIIDIVDLVSPASHTWSDLDGRVRSLASCRSSPSVMMGSVIKASSWTNQDPLLDVWLGLMPFAQIPDPR